MRRDGLAVMKKVIIIFTVFALLISLGALTFLRIQQATTPQPSNEDFLQAITHKFPDFADNNEPVITIDSISRHEYKWYIVTIKSLDRVENFVPVKLIMVDEGDNLSVILGPDTQFTELEMISHNLPESAILELQ